MIGDRTSQDVGEVNSHEVRNPINIYQHLSTNDYSIFFFQQKHRFTMVLPKKSMETKLQKSGVNQQNPVFCTKKLRPCGPIIFWSSTLIFNNHSIWEMGMVKMDRFHGQHRERVSGDVPFDQSMDSWKIHIAAQSCPPYIQRVPAMGTTEDLPGTLKLQIVVIRQQLMRCLATRIWEVQS